jgi:hypothetical protein
MDSFSNDHYDKKIDIELKKKELAEKYGAYFGQTNNISPELESEWLNHIDQFEQQFNKAQKITVWEYLGRPTYRKAIDIESEKISDELQRLMDYMNEHNIVLDTLCQVDEKELYRFITEELFFHEIDNIHIWGMMSCFTYEEFHPNAEYDIRQSYDYFFRMTLAKMENIGGSGYDLLYVDTDNYTDSKGKKLDKEKVIKSINTFLDSFDYFEVTSNKIKNIVINRDKTDATLSFEIEYKGCFNNSPEFIVYNGNGTFQLKPSEYGGWDIYYINLPGLQI